MLTNLHIYFLNQREIRKSNPLKEQKELEDSSLGTGYTDRQTSWRRDSWDQMRKDCKMQAQELRKAQLSEMAKCSVCFSKCGPWASSIRITCKFSSKNTQVQLQNY